MITEAIIAASAFRKLAKHQHVSKPVRKRKLSGEVTLDRTQFVESLDNVDKTPNRGPHPALNEEHSWSKQAEELHPALRLRRSVFRASGY